MTKKDEALKLAQGYMDGTLVTDHLTGYERKHYVMEAIRKALAEQPAKQEPAGRLESDPYEGHVFIPRIDGDWSMLGKDLYIAPPPRQPDLACLSKTDQCETQTTLCSASETQKQAQPVAWVVEDQHGERLEWAGDIYSVPGLPTFPLYTAPPPRQPLTDEQIEQCMKQAYSTVQGRNLEHAFARAIESAHGIKVEA